jgi:polyisoprenoid-binding protein YceI
MTAHYRIDPGQSRYTVQAFASGLLSFVGHSPTFAVRDFNGEIRFDAGREGIENMELELTARADGLELLDRVSAADRSDIEGRMRSEVLETAKYPVIDFRAGDISAVPVSRGQYRVRINGRLTLHGMTRPHQVEAEMLVYDDAFRLRGASPLRMSDYSIKPVTALAGAIKLRDQVELSFDLVAFPEGP